MLDVFELRVASCAIQDVEGAYQNFLTCQRCGSDLPAIASSGEAGGDEDYQPDPGS